MTASQPPYGPPQPPYGQPGPAYGQPAYGPPAPGYAPAPRSTSTRGPKITFWIGVATLVAAALVGVFAVRAIADIVPTDVIRSDGSPGAAVIAEVDVPGSGEVDLAPGTYSFYLITQDRDTDLSQRPVVTTPGGDVRQPGASGQSSTQQLFSYRAELVSVFEAEESGVHLIEVPDTLDGQGGLLYVTEGSSMGEVMGGIFGGVFGIIGAVFLGIAAIVLLLVGGIMWGVRRGNARRAAAA